MGVMKSFPDLTGVVHNKCSSLSNSEKISISLKVFECTHVSTPFSVDRYQLTFLWVNISDPLENVTF